MTQVIRSPSLARYVDELERRIAALERQLAAAQTANTYTVTPGYTADRAFDPAATTLNEVATVLATLVDDLKTTRTIKP